MDSSKQNDSTNNIIFMVAAVIFWLIGSFLVYQNGLDWFMPEAASAEAESIDALFRFMLAIATFIFLLVETTLFFFVIRYGILRDQNDTSDGPPIHGNSTLEIVWTLVPSVIVFVLTIYSFQVLVDTTEARENEFEINVTARRFVWEFQYPNDDVDDRELTSQHILVLPVNETIRLSLNSLDVIHDFWVPAFRVKQDVMPGRTTELRFTPTEVTGLPPDMELVTLDDLDVPGPEDACPIEEPVEEEAVAEDAESEDAAAEDAAAEEETTTDAETADAEAESAADDQNAEQEAPPVSYDNGYDLVCAELCGGNHGLMRGEVFVVEREVYDAYIESLRARAVAAEAQQAYAIRCGGRQILIAGRDLFHEYACNTCHQLFDAEAMALGQGPTLNNIGTRATTRPGYEDAEDYVYTSIINPNAFVVDGYPAGLMPQNFIDLIPPDQLELLVQYLLLQTEG